MPSVFCSLRLDLKPNIKRVPWAFPKEGGMEIKNKKNGETLSSEEFGGENAAGIASGGLHPLQCVHHHIQQHHLDTPTIISWQT
jgi:hypothetical protein